MSAVREKLLTASDLATLCEVDLKTIHNWVDRGRISHFRTPGRHLRFRAADVAEFLRAWGYSVPRELAKASSRTVMVVGTKDTVALVTRALGEGATPTPAQGQVPVKLAAASSEQAVHKPPIRLATHPYDALIFAGADPADIYVVDVRTVAPDADATALLEALHRACPQGTFVALVDEPIAVPPIATRVARADLTALRAALATESAPGPAADVMPAKQVAPAAMAGMGKVNLPTPISQVSSVERDDEEDEAPPRGLAVGS